VLKHLSTNLARRRTVLLCAQPRSHDATRAPESKTRATTFPFLPLHNIHNVPLTSGTFFVFKNGLET